MNDTSELIFENFIEGVRDTQCEYLLHDANIANKRCTGRPVWPDTGFYWSGRTAGLFLVLQHAN